MPYTITIHEIRTRTEKDKRWVELTRDGDHTEYGYAPEQNVQVTAQVKVYEQTVESLDLVKVIAAVNDLSEE